MPKSPVCFKSSWEEIPVCPGKNMHTDCLLLLSVAAAESVCFLNSKCFIGFCLFVSWPEALSVNANILVALKWACGTLLGYAVCVRALSARARA